MDSITNPAKFTPRETKNGSSKDPRDISSATQEKLALLKELDTAMKKHYHQSLDDVLRDLYMHDVISNPDLSADEIVRTLSGISILKDETDFILRRFRI